IRHSAEELTHNSLSLAHLLDMRGRTQWLAVSFAANARRLGWLYSSLVSRFAVRRQLTVHNGYSEGDFEPEERVRNGRIKLPVLEFEFDLDATSLSQDDPYELIRILGDFEKKQISFRMRSAVLRGGIGRGLRALERARQHHVAILVLLLISSKIHSRANARQFHFARQQGQGRSPVGALLRRNTGHRVVSGNVKPSCRARDEKQIL